MAERDEPCTTRERVRAGVQCAQPPHDTLWTGEVSFAEQVWVASFVESEGTGIAAATRSH